MKINEKIIFNFLENHGEYLNTHDVCFETFSKQELSVSARYPNFTPPAEGMEILITTMNMPFARFLTLFNISCIEDIQLIKPARLLKLFGEGKAELLCLIEEDYGLCLFFNNRKSGMTCYDIELKQRELKEPLFDANEILNFTRDYYATFLAQPRPRKLHWFKHILMER